MHSIFVEVYAAVAVAAATNKEKQPSNDNFYYDTG